MKYWTVLAILVPVLLGCESAPPEPDVPTGMSVSYQERGRLSGARAYYAVHAPVADALEVIIDFDRYSEFRPGVVESRTIGASKAGGQAFVRFQGLYADDINASCDYTIAESDGVYRVEYKMADSSFGMWAHQGKFILMPAKNGEWTVIDQEIMVSALSSSADAARAAMRADAEAFQQRIEATAGTGAR